jgi:excisionase family DNA binding protein
MDRTSYSRRPVEKLATALATGAITDDDASRMLREVGRGTDKLNRAIFNLKDSASYVGISEGHFRRLVEEGVFPSITLGRSRWWRRVDLDKALEARALKAS